MSSRIQRVLKVLVVTLGSVFAVLVVALIALGLSFPSIGSYKSLVESYLSEHIGGSIRMRRLEAEWRGLSPSVRMYDVRVGTEEGEPSAVLLGELLVVVDPFQLLMGRLNFDQIVLSQPELEVVRNPDGSVVVANLASDGQSADDGLNALAWIFQQNVTDIKDANLVWRDRREPSRSIRLEQVNLRLWLDGSERRFEGTAMLAAGGQKLGIAGRLQGIPFAQRAWSGNVNIDLTDLDLARVPLALHEIAPWYTEGILNAQISTSWMAGVLSAVTADFSLADFSVPFAGGDKMLAAEHFESQFSWHLDPDIWRLAFIDPTLQINRQTLRADQLSVDLLGNVRAYHAEGIDIGPVAAMLADLDIVVPWQNLIKRVKPVGRWQQLSLVVEGPFLSSEQWRLEGEYSGLGWESYQNYPGVKGVDGTVAANSTTGSLNIHGTNVRVSMPHVRTGLLGFESFESKINWDRKADHWQVEVDGLALANQDLKIDKGSVLMRLPLLTNENTSPHLDLNLHFPRARMSTVKDYLPLGVMPDDAIQWLGDALVAGDLTDTKLRIEGLMDDFPFAAGGGEFRLRTNVRNGVLNYASGWPRLKDMEAAVSIDNSAFKASITTSRLWRSEIKRATVESGDLFASDREININAALDSPVSDIIQFLTRGPLIQEPGGLRLAGSGRGLLDLDIFLPFKQMQAGTRVAGRYQVDEVGLEIEGRSVFTDLKGAIAFTESTISGEDISAKLWQGETTLGIETITPGTPPVWKITATGMTDVDDLEFILGDQFVTHAAGRAPWSGDFVARPGLAELRVESNLEGIGISLPPPLDKEPAHKLPLSVAATFTKGSRKYNFDLGALFGGLEFTTTSGGSSLKRGIIGLGETGDRELPADGLTFIARYPDLDTDAWLRLLSAGGTGDEAGVRKVSLRQRLRKIDIETDQLKLLSRNLGALRISADSSDGNIWNGTINGVAARGRGVVEIEAANGSSSYSFVFEHLNWPRGEGSDEDRTSDDVDPRSFPHLKIDAESFQYGNWKLGATRLAAEPVGTGWRITTATFDQPELSIVAAGEWFWNQGRSYTHIDANFDSKDIGGALEKLDLGDQLGKGEGLLMVALSWQGAPHDFSFARLNGEYQISAKKGRFLNVNPGSGRLLGLFNIEALRRRVNLDFSDVFSKGFAFDRVKGKGEITNGDLTTEDLYVVGPSAFIGVEGRTGLAREDYDLNITVAPALGANLSLISAFANPIAGAVLFLAQKVFKRQLAKMVHYEYNVSGSWESPEIELIKHKPTRNDFEK